MNSSHLRSKLQNLTHSLQNTFDKEIDMDWRKTLNQLNGQINSTYDSGVEGLFDRLGYEQKRTNTDFVIPAISVFGAGLLVGAALGVLFAPKRGDEIRGDLRHRLDDLRTRGEERYDELRSHRLENVDG